MAAGDWQRDVLRELRQPGAVQDQAAAPDDPQPPATAAPATPHATLPTGPTATGPTAAPRSPLPTPESVPVMDPRLALVKGRPQHGDSVARRTGHSLRRLTSSAARDVAEATRVAEQLQQPVTTGRHIAVTSIRGGAGKSTVSALLSRIFNHYRHDPVLTLEADTALGTLPVRLGVESVRWSCADLARILKPSMQLTDITGYLVPLEDGGWLLPAGQGRVGAQLDIRTYRLVTMALRRYFGVTVVDCESLPGDIARTAVDTAHGRVLVAPATVEGVVGARTVLDWMAGLPRTALPGTVVALTSVSPDMTTDLKAASRHLQETGVPVIGIPYDRHLAAGGPVRTDLLGQATRQSATLLAAEVLRRAAALR
ncbi:MinD/ParA family ATP-binding protein [Streptomyces sp. NPDC002926]